MTKKILTKFVVQLLSLTLAFLPLASLSNNMVHAATINPVLGPNLISNPSVDTPDATNPTTAPDGWTFGQADDASIAGTSTVSDAYVTPGHTGTYAVQVSTSNYVDGDVEWAPSTNIPVTPNQAYQFTDWYESGATTEVDVEYDYTNAADVPVTTDGSCDVTALACYDQLVASVAPATDWAQVTADFTVPAGVTSVSVYHLLGANGTLTTDDYSLSTYTPAPFTHPMVSVTFDDGWENQYTNAAPYMQSLSLPGTYYIISGESDTAYDPASGYMSPQDVQSLHTMGDEVGGHTVHHCNLADLPGSGETPSDDTLDCPSPIPASTVLSEMQDSKTNLEQLVGAPVTDFAYPYGAYNASTVNLGESLGYASQRTVNPGYNTADNFSPNELYMYEVDSDISVQQVKTWIDDAVSQGAWLVLCYHEVADTPSDPSDSLYTTKIADFQAEMSYLQSKQGENAGQTEVKTVADALTEAESQVNTSPAPFSMYTAATATSQKAAAVTWTTNQASTGQVEYGTTTAYGQTAQDTQSIATHSLTLTGLTAGTTYHVRVTSTDAAGDTIQSNDLTFTTLPAGTAGDISGPNGIPDGVVDDNDALVMYSEWGAGANLPADISGPNGIPDGVVDDNDALVMYANWSK